MAISKIEFDGHSLIDLTNDTATEQSVEKGKTFHKADGTIATGTADVVHSETISEEAYELDIPDSFYADVKKIGGKSVKWNQLCSLFDKTQWRVNATVANKDIINGEIIISDPSTSSAYLYTTFDVIAGHKYLVLTRGFYEGSDMTTQHATFATYLAPSIAINITKNDNLTERIWSPTTSGTDRAEIRFNVGGHANNITIHCSQYSLIDLTAIFGSGNEPTSVDDERIKWLKSYAERHPEYDGGSIVNAEVTEVKGTSTLPLPSITSLPDYGAGIGDVYNYVDTEPVKYENMVEVVFNGSESWKLQSINSYGIANFYLENLGDTFRYLAIGDLVKQTSSIAATSSEGYMYSNALATYIRINSSKATTSAEFKEYLRSNPLHFRCQVTGSGSDYWARLYHRRVKVEGMEITPITEQLYDATPYIPSSLLDVDNASKITFENDAHLEVPIEVKLLAKGSAVQPMSIEPNSLEGEETPDEYLED